MAWHFSRAGGWADEKFTCENCKRAKLHRVRNCRYFPTERRNGRVSWVHQISVQAPSRGKQPIVRTITVAGSHSSECPTSGITPYSLHILEMVHGARMTKEATGACLFGPDTANWPAWYFDAVRTVHAASIAEDEARMKGQS